MTVLLVLTTISLSVLALWIALGADDTAHEHAVQQATPDRTETLRDGTGRHRQPWTGA